MNFGITEVILFVIGQVVLAASIWGAIRADIKGMHVRINDLKEAIDKAHRRIDDHLDSQMNMDQYYRHNK